MAMVKRKIGILASGGDSSGMNACVYYLNKHLTDCGFEVINFEGGYNGLCNNKVAKVTLKEMQARIDDGGCIIKSSRSPLYMTNEGRDMAARTQKELGLECIIIIGGNGSLKGIIDGYPHGLRCIGIPATVDNDVFYTSYSIGFDSAANANIQITRATKNTCYSCDRIPIMEIMGRDCGKLTLATAIGTGADICIVKEVPKTIDNVISEIKALKKSGKDNILIVAAELNLDLNELSKKIHSETCIESRLSVSGYAQRGPETSAFDRILAAMYALKACELVKEKKYGNVVGRTMGHTLAMPVEEALAVKSNFDHETYNAFFKII